MEMEVGSYFRGIKLKSCFRRYVWLYATHTSFRNLFDEISEASARDLYVYMDQIGSHYVTQRLKSYLMKQL